jgi:hypothetical protein
MSYQPGPPAPGQPPHFTLDSNDRILAALGYVIWIVAVVVALLDETKSKPLLKDHAVQGIGFAVAGFAFLMVAGVFYICAAIISLGILALVLWPIFFVPNVVGIYYGYLAYNQNELVEIPWLTQFMAEQGWFQTRKAM